MQIFTQLFLGKLLTQKNLAMLRILEQKAPHRHEGLYQN
jgi:hypothetical protein